MGSRSDAYGSSEWLNKDVLKGQFSGMFTGTINGAGLHEFEDGKKQVYITFDNTDYKLGLNAGNFDIIADAVQTDDYDTWADSDITVEAYIDPNVMFGGKRTGGVRLRNVRVGANGSSVADAPSTLGAAADKFIEAVESEGATVEGMRTAYQSLGINCVGEPANWPASTRAKFKEALALAIDMDVPF